MYTGGMEATMDVLPDETPDEYADRVILYLAPILDIRPRIDWYSMDASVGIPFYTVEEGTYSYGPVPRDEDKQLTIGGPNGAQAIVMRRIREMGIEVCSEPAFFPSVAHMQTNSTLMTDNFHNLHQGLPLPWTINNSQGVSEELVHPTGVLDRGNTVIISDRTSWLPVNLGDEAKIAAAAEWNASGYSVTLPITQFPGAN